jgi:hypothetical protein
MHLCVVSGEWANDVVHPLALRPSHAIRCPQHVQLASFRSELRRGSVCACVAVSGEHEVDDPGQSAWAAPLHAPSCRAVLKEDAAQIAARMMSSSGKRVDAR